MSIRTQTIIGGRPEVETYLIAVENENVKLHYKLAQSRKRIDRLKGRNATLEFTYDHLASFAHALKNVDWQMLYQQRMTLVDAIADLRKDYPMAYTDELTGILNLLDALSDASEEAGLWQHPGPVEN